MGLDDGVGPSYAAYYAGIDPRRQFALDHQSPGELLACQEHFDDRYVSRSEFFQDYLLPIGVHYMLGTTLLNNPSSLVQLAFQRYVGHGRFSGREMGWAERLIPHLQRAMALLMQSNALRQSAEVAGAGLEASPLALFAVDPGGRVVFSNRKAEALLRDGTVLALRHGVLHAKVAEQYTALAGALASTAQSGASCNLLLSAPPGSPDPARFSVTTIPVHDPDRHGFQGLQTGAVVLCLIARLDGRRVATASQLMQIFQLTPAEARLLRALAQGTTLDDYARECGVRVTTLKTQLKSLFAKTGTCRQVDLIRLAMDIPVVRQ